jgi:hypothetical protein
MKSKSSLHEFITFHCVGLVHWQIAIVRSHRMTSLFKWFSDAVYHTAVVICFPKLPFFSVMMAAYGALPIYRVDTLVLVVGWANPVWRTSGSRVRNIRQSNRISLLGCKRPVLWAQWFPHKRVSLLARRVGNTGQQQGCCGNVKEGELSKLGAGIAQSV